MKNLHDTGTWEAVLLTPLHIGDSVELKQNLDFIIGNNHLKVIDQESLLDRLQEYPQAISELGRYGFRLDRFARDYKIQLDAHYTLPIKGNTPQIFRRFIKNAYGRPYLPGSSLKGALRTALWTTLDRSRLPGTRDYRNFENAVKKLQGADPHHDFLRPLYVSDSREILPDGSLEVHEVKFFNIQHNNRTGWKDFSTRTTKNNFADATGMHVEALKAGTVLYAKVCIDRYLQIPQIQNVSGIPKIKGLSSLDEMAKAVNEHSLHIADAEKRFFSQFNGSVAPVITFYEDLISRIDTLSHQEDGSFIVRLAWGSGWRGMTGNWMEEDDLDVIRRKTGLGKNGCPKCQARARWDNRENKLVCMNKTCGHMFTDNEKWFHPVFPKTRRLAMKNGVPCLPFGWVVVRPLSKDIFTMQEHVFYTEKDEESVNESCLAKSTGDTVESASMIRLEPSPAPEPEIATWETATLVWTPNNQTITAASGNKKALVTGKELVPEKYHKKLFVKPKSITATIDVEPIGNGFRIVKIYE